MSFIADTHVHLYPAVYSVEAVCAALARNLGRLVTGDAARVACLVEREGQHVLRDLQESGRKAPPTGVQESGRKAPPTGVQGEAGSLAVATTEGTVHLIAGRQFVAVERIEILGLTVDLELADGLPAAEFIERILAAGGVPVLSWAPGKWFFKRGRVVGDLIKRFGAKVLLGDTTMRPLGWGEPCLMRAGRRQGLRVVAGSDPLPVAGDERLAGTYATLFDVPFDVARPVTSMRAALLQAVPPSRVVGRRGNVFTVAGRIRGHAGTKAGSPSFSATNQ